MVEPIAPKGSKAVGRGKVEFSTSAEKSQRGFFLTPERV